jgi:hypothetical protein
MFPDTSASGVTLSEAASKQITTMWATPTISKLRSIRAH